MSAQLEGVLLDEAELQGASLDGAQLQGTSLNRAQLQGASLDGAQLQGASLDGVQLQGASLTDAQLQGASLVNAKLQGTNFSGSVMTHADLSGTFVWRSKGAACGDARVRDHTSVAIIEFRPPRPYRQVQATPKEVARFIDRWTADITNEYFKEKAGKRMRAGLVVDAVKDDTAEIAQVWSVCQEVTEKKTEEEFDRELVLFLRNLVCNARGDRKAIARGIVSNWAAHSRRRNFSALLASGLLGRDNDDCAATKDFDDQTKERLRDAIAASADVPPRRRLRREKHRQNNER